jgi:hypothetical protein
MPEYVLDHHQQGERQRLAQRSQLLDPMQRHHLEGPGIGSGFTVVQARTLST